MAFKIDNELCIGCQACVGACPVAAISVNEEGAVVIDPDKCISCGTCGAICPKGAPKSE